MTIHLLNNFLQIKKNKLLFCILLISQVKTNVKKIHL